MATNSRKFETTVRAIFCNVKVNFRLADEEYTIGIVVDEESEVLHFNDKDIEDTPEFGTNLDTNDFLSMAKSEGGVKIFLYISRFLSVEEKNTLEKNGIRN